MNHQKFIQAKRAEIHLKKQLGQHLLTDKNIVEKIIASCELRLDETVLEIGPGLGALTGKILPNVQKLIIVEKDKQLCHELQKAYHQPHLEIIDEDFLKYELPSLSDRLKVIGNLPYYITSPIIQKLIDQKDKISSIFITVQLEFGHRMVSQPGTKEYSPLSLFVQFFTEPKMLFKIKSNAFKPIPKVDSCFMRLDIRKKSLFEVTDQHHLFKIIHLVFQQRRKTILNALSSALSSFSSGIKKSDLEEIFKSLNIDPLWRPENLKLEHYVRLSNYLMEKGIR